MFCDFVFLLLYTVTCELFNVFVFPLGQSSSVSFVFVSAAHTFHMLSHSKFIRVVINMIFGIGDVCVCVSSLELICKLFIWWVPRKMLAHSNNAINTNVFGLSMLIAVDFTSICNAYCLFFAVVARACVDLLDFFPRCCCRYLSAHCSFA